MALFLSVMFNFEFVHFYTISFLLFASIVPVYAKILVITLEFKRLTSIVIVYMVAGQVQWLLLSN